MEMKEWLDDVAPSVNAAAGEIGMTTSTLARQLASRDGLPAETVIRIARAYGRPPVEALVELGFLDAGEVSQGIDRVEVSVALARATEKDLLREIGARLDRNDSGPREVDAQATGIPLPSRARGKEKSPGEEPAARAAQKRRPKGERIDVGGTEPVVKKSGARASRGRS